MTPRLTPEQILSNVYSAWNTFLMLFGIAFVGFIGGLFGGALGAYLWERFAR